MAGDVSRAPVEIVARREQGETQVAGVVPLRQKLERSAGSPQQLCWPLTSSLVIFAEFFCRTGHCEP